MTTVITLNKLVVSAYKAVGFGVLTLLLVGLVSFFGLNVFFFVSRSWVAPTVVSPSDERVVAASALLAQQVNAREKLGTERSELEARLAQADRAVAAELAYQADFRASAEHEREVREGQLTRLEPLRRKLKSTKWRILTANRAFAKDAAQRLDGLRSAHLIDGEAYLGAGRQLSEMSRQDLELASSEATMEVRIATLRHDVAALQAMQQALDGQGTLSTAEALSYEVLQMKEGFLRSAEALAKAGAERAVVLAALDANGRAASRYDRLLRSIQDSPYLRAAEHDVTVAFVPYENFKEVRPGTPVYACRLGILVCRQVGLVGELIEGEVTARHPVYTRPERGFMARVELTDLASAKERVLFAGSAPLFL